MEIEIEKNINEEGNENESDNEEKEIEQSKKDLLEIEYVEQNPLDNQENDYLLFSTFGNASGYIKLALYQELRKTSGAFKGKFMSYKKDQKNQPKKLNAELYQFKDGSNYHLVLFEKKDFSRQAFKIISDMVLSKVKRVVTFDSKYYKDIISIDDKESLKNKVYCIKNKIQLISNQMIKALDFPVFNGLFGFNAYLQIKTETLKLPCVSYVASHTELSVCMDNIKIFDSFLPISYAFLRGKVSEDNLNLLGVSTDTILSEFNNYKNSIFV